MMNCPRENKWSAEAVAIKKRLLPVWDTKFKAESHKGAKRMLFNRNPKSATTECFPRQSRFAGAWKSFLP